MKQRVDRSKRPGAKRWGFVLWISIGCSCAWAAGAPNPPFVARVDLLTFMEHVISPAADRIWSVGGTIYNETGAHELTPTTDAQWEEVITGAATLSEASNALMIPQRARDLSWYRFASRLGDAAQEAWAAAEKHDAKGVAAVSDRLDQICTDCHKHYGVE